MSLAPLLAALRSEALPDPARRQELLALTRRIADAPANEIEQLLEALARFVVRHGGQAAVPVDRDALVARVLECVAESCRLIPGGHRRALTTPAIAHLAELYERLGPRGENRFQLPRALAADGGPAALAAFAELMSRDPPCEPRQCDLAFVPLFQQPSLAAQALFPQLLEALRHPSLAVLVLDLANHVTRKGLMKEHPARERLPQLLELFGGVVARLQELEQRPDEFAASPRELAQLVGDSSALLIALCDALGLIGDDRAVGRLRQALDLSHRRLRAEAAAALARLKDKQGVEILIELTREPSLRQRAIAYLRELSLGDKIPPEAATPQAAAEGELAAWLADPLRFGIAPQRIELFDHCQRHWPGHKEPVDCYLFRCEYDFPAGRWSGIGIAGPLVLCLNVDVADLPPADIYALYAGWQLAHDEPREPSIEAFNDEQQQQAACAEQELAERGYDDARVVKLAEVGGEQAAVAAARVSSESGVAVLLAGTVAWFPRRNSSRPIGPDEAYWIVLGRRANDGTLEV